MKSRPSVLVPYKITLLSNFPEYNIALQKVLVPYKITLLSNYICHVIILCQRFSTL